MRMIAYVLAIICLIAAVVYFAIPAGSLPTFMPGYEAGSQQIHKPTPLPPSSGRSSCSCWD